MEVVLRATIMYVAGDVGVGTGDRARLLRCRVWNRSRRIGMAAGLTLTRLRHVADELAQRGLQKQPLAFGLHWTNKPQNPSVEACTAGLTWHIAEGEPIRYETDIAKVKRASAHLSRSTHEAATALPLATPHGVGAMFLAAERSGLKLAIVVRTVTLLLAGAWAVGTRADDATRAVGYALLFAVLAALGAVHYALIGSRFERSWVKYLFVALDITIVSALIATRPLFPTASDLPAVTIFRAPFFPFYFVILGIWALSFSPGVVAWTGLVGALGWMGAFLHAASEGPQNLNWTDIPANPSGEQVLRVLLDPNFGGLSGHVQEAVSLGVVAILISIVMWRARETLKRQLQAERDHAALSGLFGRFVPQAVVNAMIAGRGALAPIEREATVLYSDIADFTAMTDRIGATRTVAVLNAYFDEVTRIIGDHNGIVTQFHGDAVLATFNVPVEDLEHAAHAFSAARAILALVEARDFDGERLRVRIGMNTGSLVAGNVGGGGRQSYTVYGGTVNLAARLEALCKDHGTSLLVSAATAEALPDAGLVPVGSIVVRGLVDPVRVFSLVS